MSTIIMETRETKFVSFYGGRERGRSLQISIGDEFCQLDNKEVKELIKVLTDKFIPAKETTEKEYVDLELK